MPLRDVVVTGIGLVTPLGLTARETAHAFRNGAVAERSALQELHGTQLEGFGVGTLSPMDAAERVGNRRMLKFMSPAAVLGAAAAREAMAEARVRDRFDPARVGLYAGTGLAAASIDEVRPMIEHSIEDGCFSSRLLGTRGLAATHPLLSFRILANMPACIISILENIQGPSLIFTPWEGQTGAALLEAFLAVSSGEVDCAVAGGSDQPAHPATLVYLRSSRRIGPEEYPSPGAGYLVLESAERARADGLPVLARIASLGLHTVGDCSSSVGRDPLASRMGRTYAAAPAILLGLLCQGIELPGTLLGADAQEFRAVVESGGCA